MPSPLKILQSNIFVGGVDSDTSADLMPVNTARYMLNCNVLSSSGGDVGVVTNLKGNIQIPIPLPPSGVSEIIGSASDEERNYLYFALWNSDGYHTWYRYDHVSGAVDIVFRCRTMTGDVDIWGWKRGVMILHADIIGNNILSWSMEGQPARELDVSKAIGGEYIGATDADTRAYKRAPTMPPSAEYATDEGKAYNRVFGNQFRFASRFHYSTGAKSNWSDWGNVARPEFEQYSGEDGVPLQNNAIEVGLETGSWQVTHIEIGMQKTNPEGGVLPWVSIDVLDKEKNGISDDSSYTFRFYNDSPTSAIPPEDIIRPYSYLPKNPKAQAFVKNAMLYANFYEGFPDVALDVGTSVRYEDLFLDPDTGNELNSPDIYILNRQILYDDVSDGWFGRYEWRGVQADLYIAEDVKKGNKFEFRFYDSRGEVYYASVTAGYGDTAKSISQKFHNLFSQKLGTQDSKMKTAWFQSLTDVQVDMSGNAYFNFRHWNGRDRPRATLAMSVNPVSTTSLQDAGQSVQIIKLGSSARYGILYEDEDGRKSAVYTNNSMVVNIDTINELGSIKQPVISFEVNHPAPEWAASYQIVRTKNLVQRRFVQLLIQKVVTHTSPSGDVYMDLHLGSLFTYQRAHPNTVVRYSFTKGDRLRLISQFNDDAVFPDPDWVIAGDAKDYEVIDYNEVVITEKDDNITLDGSNTVTVGSTDAQYIGMMVEVNGYEREITGLNSGTEYELDRDFDTGDPDNTTKTFPSYRIINRNGSVRIKYDSNFPIVADPDSDEFALVEIYTPSVGVNTVDDNIYYGFGQKFMIIDGYHTGNIQNQSPGQPAIIDIDNGDSYVRYRELPVSNTENPSVLISSIEDANYSDFYVSDMSDDGRAYGLDTGQGEVHFGSRIRWSRNYIEGTKINGLNDFDNLSREDYNDKYGDIERILASEDRLYVLKYLKAAWLPVYGRRITTQDDQEQITSSPDILPNMLTYFLWDGGVGGNPESVVRNGNNIYFVSPDSGIFARIGGSGVIPTSSVFNLDSETRKLLESAKKSGSKVISWFDRKNDNWELSIEPHDNLIYDSPVSGSGWELSDAEIPSGAVTVAVTSSPAHGSTSISGETITYTPDTGYSGPDSYEYTISVDGVPQETKHVCIDVNYVEGPKIWRPINPFCVLVDGVRNGSKGWNTLEEFDTLNQVPTGVTKPNVPSDPDYVAPVYDATACTPQESFLLFTTTSTSPSMAFNVSTGSTPVFVQAVVGGVVLDTSSESTTPAKTLDMSGNTGTAEVRIIGPVGVASSLTEVISNNNNVFDVNLKFPNLNRIEYRTNSISTLDLSDSPSLISITAPNNYISAIDIADVPGLLYLEIDTNTLSTLDTSAATGLLWCLAGGNSLTSVDFTYNTDLTWVRLNYNTIPSVDISMLSDLTRFEAEGNNLSSISLGSNTLLEIVNLRHNNLSSISLAGLTDLEVFEISDNNITAIDFTDNTSLKSVRVDVNDLSALDVSMLPDLEALICVKNDNLATLSISANNNLTELRCGECDFTADDADPTIVDAIIIKMDSNIVTGGLLHYDTTIPGGIQPTNASRAAYDSLVVKGCDLQGKVPLP